jgi:hypothetical protein
MKTRSSIILLAAAVMGCNLAHEYRSGELPRLQRYTPTELAGVFQTCEFATSLRRDASGTRLFLVTATGRPPGCNAPFLDRLLVLEKGRTPLRTPLARPMATIGDDGSAAVDLLLAERDQSGAPFFVTAGAPDWVPDIRPVAIPDVVVARSLIVGWPTRLFSRGRRHWICGSQRGVARGKGACEIFEENSQTKAWRLARTLHLGNHYAVDLDPSSETLLVEAPRDDCEPLLFAVDLPTWKWRYLGAGPTWGLLFMEIDPLGRSQTGQMERSEGSGEASSPRTTG